VGFVVGPQVYGNYEGFVVRSAESQQFLFHSLLQRAGNGSRTPMLVGTNNALRVSALRQIGGFQDSITEDMATSVIFHTTRNPETNKRWTSVYTPDVVSVGEGPASFTDYFSQQDRWSRGTDEVLVRRFWRMAHRLGPRAMVHYLLLTAYYPTAAIAWILGAVNAILYFALGAGGVVVPAHLWLMLYVDAAALQIGLYFFNRRHNISPHEKKGSAGVAGMLISALSAPIYAASLAAVALRRSRGFVTTPKGDASTRDTLITFRKHVLWALVFGVPLLFSFVLGHHHFSMRAWSVASLIVCLLPVAIWRVELARERRTERREEPVPAPAEPAEPVRREHLRPVPDLPREPVREEPLTPAAFERRKRHEVVRFDRRVTLTRDRHGAVERSTTGPVRELRQGRRKNHVVVRFDPPQGHQFGEHPEQAQAWQVFDQAEA
jgi:Glycosyl transferase family group 2